MIDYNGFHAINYLLFLYIISIESMTDGIAGTIKLMVLLFINPITKQRLF